MLQKLFILSPDVVFRARVNLASASYPVLEIPFDNVTVGSYTAVKPEMTILLGSTSGADDLGRQRIRKAATSNTLYVGRSSIGSPDGQLTVTDNAYISVLGDRRIWSKIPNIVDGVQYKDGDLAYTDQTELLPPKANIAGGAVAATIDGSGIITVTFDGSGSYAQAAGATLTGYAWDVDDGTITAGTGTDTLTATFPAGSRYVRLTVTDSNSKTHYMEVPVYADDPAASDCVAFECVEHRITQAGQTAAFRILENLPAADYPDGTLVIFWEGEPSGPSDRTNVLFWGWHQTDSNTLTAERTATLKDLTLYCLDPAGRMATLPVFSQSLINNSAPADWGQMKDANLDNFGDYLLRWGSNVLELCYYESSGIGADYPFVILSSPDGSIYSQANDTARAFVPDHILTCNRRGELHVLPDPMFQATGDRTATVQDTLNEAKYTAVQWDRTRPPRSHWNWGSALKASPTAIEALFCVAPGTAPGQGLSSMTSSYRLAISQDDLNSCEGNRYARANAFYSVVPVTLTSDYGIEPADMTWVRLNVAGDYAARRALGFSNARGLPLEINITYNYQRTGATKTIELLWEQETSGPPATTQTLPETDWEPPYIPPIDPPDPPPDPTTEGDGFGTVYVMADNTLRRCNPFSAASPSWTDVSGAAAGEVMHSWILHPFRHQQEGFLLTEDGVWHATGLDTSPTLTQVLSSADVATALGGTNVGIMTGTSLSYKIVSSINSDGYVSFVFMTRFGTEPRKWYSAQSGDDGATWSFTYISDKGDGNSTGHNGALDIVPHVVASNLRLYASVMSIGTGGANKLYRTDDAGGSWSEVADGPQSGPIGGTVVHCPYNGNTNGNLVYWSAASGGNDPGAFKSTDGGPNSTALNIPDDAGSLIDLQSRVSRTGIETFTQDSNLVYMWQNALNRLLTSTDGGDNWSIVTPTAGFSGTPVASGGFPYNDDLYYLVTTAGIYVSTDRGQNWVNKTGNWASFSATAYRTVIVPVWGQE